MRSRREHDLHLFKESTRRLGRAANGVFDELDKRRKKRENRVTISHDMWIELPMSARNNFSEFFKMYLIVKHKHWRAIDMRPFDIAGEDKYGIICILCNDSGKGWFNNGIS